MFGGYASKALCFNVCNARFVGEMQTCLHAECRINSVIIRACGYAEYEMRSRYKFQILLSRSCGIPITWSFHIAMNFGL